MVDRNSSRHMPDSNTAAIHDMAFYPLCKWTNWTELNFSFTSRFILDSSPSKMIDSQIGWLATIEIVPKNELKRFILASVLYWMSLGWRELFQLRNCLQFLFLFPIYTQAVKTIKHHGLKKIRPNCISHRTFSRNWYQIRFYIGRFYGKFLVKCDYLNFSLTKICVLVLFWCDFKSKKTSRLRQKIPDNLPVTDASIIGEMDSQNGCSDVDDIIHVKISIFVKRLIRGGNNRIGNSANYGSGRRGN